MDEEDKKLLDHFIKHGLSRFILIACIITTVALLLNYCSRSFNANTQREIFTQSKTYVNGMIDDLAEYKYQWDTAEDEIERKAIENLIRRKYSNFNAEHINNQPLKNWLFKIQGGL